MCSDQAIEVLAASPADLRDDLVVGFRCRRVERGILLIRACLSD
jgi:hypothetical protein